MMLVKSLVMFIKHNGDINAAACRQHAFGETGKSAGVRFGNDFFQFEKASGMHTKLSKTQTEQQWSESCLASHFAAHGHGNVRLLSCLQGRIDQT